jgi:hypothetical protein
MWMDTGKPNTTYIDMIGHRVEPEADIFNLAMAHIMRKHDVI